VQHHDRTDLSAEVPLVGRDRLQSLSRCLEQHRVDGRLVVIGDRRHRRRQREHHMEVLDRQQVGSAGAEPLAGCRTLALRAMTVAAAIVGDPLVPAVDTALDVTTERGSPARFDGPHHAQLGSAQMPGVGDAERVAVLAEDIRHLEHRTCAGHLLGPRSQSRVEIVERASGPCDQIGCDLRVALRR